jgi:hypothetical protein
MRQRIGLVVAFFVAAVICPRVSWAMDLGMFDDMARLDQRDYLKYLVKNTEQVLSEEGRPDLAKQVHELFSRNPSGDPVSLGETQFQRFPESFRAYVAAHPSLRFPITVESALMQVLAQHIPLPNAFPRDLAQTTRAKPFWPKLPLRTN